MSGRLPEYYIPYMVDVALSLGSNSGDRRFYMRRMEEMGGQIFQGAIFVSALMETEPLEVSGDQPWYLNRIVRGGFGGSARELLEECKAIERSLGRTNKGMRMERTADVDILLFGQCEIADSDLTIPHPAIYSRRFCLEGLNQVMPDAPIGASNMTVGMLFADMPPEMGVQRILCLEEQEVQL